MNNNNNVKVKSELCSMTWKEAEERFRENPVILIPMGSIEQHGPQTPVGDYRYTIKISQAIAEKTGAISAPTIPWGYSEYFKNFPGCLTLQPETLKALLFDILDGFLRHGLDHFIFVCGHKGNVPIIEQVARTIKEQYGIRTATIEPLSWLTRNFLSKVYGVNDFEIGHGSDPMTSLAMYLFPGDVRMDLAEKGSSGVFAGLPLKGMSQAEFNGYPVFIYCNTEEVTSNGILGDPTLASTEAGEKCFNHMVEVGVEFVRWFTKLDIKVNNL